MIIDKCGDRWANKAQMARTIEIVIVPSSEIPEVVVVPVASIASIKSFLSSFDRKIIPQEKEKAMNKPSREPCRTCDNYRYCGLERRGICTDYKKKKETRTINKE